MSKEEYTKYLKMPSGDTTYSNSYDPADWVEGYTSDTNWSRTPYCIDAGDPVSYFTGSGSFDEVAGATNMAYAIRPAFQIG